MKFKIVSDSSSNVRELADIAFESVPLKIITEEKEYVDDAMLDVPAMVEDLRTVKGKTGTSCPNVSEWLDAFEGAENVFAVTITSNLSGSCAAAIQAAAEYEETHEGAHAYVVDSLSTGGEMRLIMEHIRSRVQAGDGFEQIRDSVQNYQKHTHLLFSLQSLANLARNGEISLDGLLGLDSPNVVDITREGDLHRATQIESACQLKRRLARRSYLGLCDLDSGNIGLLIESEGHSASQWIYIRSKPNTFIR